MVSKESNIPITVVVTISGAADYLYHRWNVQEVEAKAKAVRGSSIKKCDNVESYVYRNEEGYLSIPGEQFRMSILGAAKYKKDPRSPKKSAMDIYKAGIVPLTALASVGKKTWDYEDQRRVVIQRMGINRKRPALKAGWKATFEMLILIPEYISPDDLKDTVTTAGRLVGIGDFRPTFGRFDLVDYQVL